MSITSASVLVDGTVATTGGTATTMLSKGNTLDQHKVILDDGSEFIAATTIDFAVKEPKVSTSAPNGYTQRRRTVKILSPLALDNGNTTVNSMKIELSCDHEMTAAEITSLKVLAAQLIHDSDFDEFWEDGSTA